MPHRPEKKHTLQRWTIEKLIEEYDTIDCEPVGQRPPIQVRGNGKARGILRFILEGNGLGEITLMLLANPGGPFLKFILESIDGGHRKRFIYEFYNNCFSVKFTDWDGNEVEKYYSDLSEEEKSAFLETEFSVDIYKTLSVQEKGKLFRKLNKTSEVRFMEMCNSYGDIPIANFVRELVRTVKGINNEHHVLFDHCAGSGTTHKYLSFNNNRLAQDQALARIVLRYVKYPKQLLGGSTEDEIEDMYSEEKIGNSVKDGVIKHLDFLHSMALGKKSWSNGQLAQHDFKSLSFLYFWMVDRYGLFVIPDAEKFMQIYLNAKTVIQKPGGKYDKKNMTDGSGYTFRTAYNKYINAPQNTKKVQSATEILVKEMTTDKIEKVINIFDKKRCFAMHEKTSKLLEQEGKCYIDGTKLLYKDAEAAHIVAYSKGGKTKYENLAMVRKKWNQDMGSMDLEKYKEAFHRNNKKAA